MVPNDFLQGARVLWLPLSELVVSLAVVLEQTPRTAPLLPGTCCVGGRGRNMELVANEKRLGVEFLEGGHIVLVTT